MAYLSDGDDRGQLILVAAIALAVLFVGLAVVLNSVIYTENIASRSSTFSGDAGPSTYRGEVDRAVDGVIADANAADANDSARTARVAAGVAQLDDALRRYYAASGVSTNVSLAGPGTGGVIDGTAIEQGADAAFTEPESGAPDWTVARDVRMRAFAVTVDRDSLRDAGDPNPFTVVVVANDSAAEWRITLTRESVEGAAMTNVTVSSPGGETETCVASGSRSDVAVTAGRVDGAPCDALDFFERTVGPDGGPGTYDVRFENATSNGSPTADGQYRLVVDATGGFDANYGYESDAVSASNVVYGVRVRIGYYAPDVRYETVFRVAPGEPDV